MTDFIRQSFYHIARVEPQDHTAKIIQPTLYLAAAEDPLTAPVEIHRKTRARMGLDAEFRILEPHHLATYFGEPFDKAIAVGSDFLKRVL